MSDDFSPAPEDYNVPEGEGLIYLLAKVDGAPRGFWLFVPQNHVCYEVHTVTLPVMRRHVFAAAKLSERWIWTNTPCQRIYTNVPSHNSLALKFAKAIGMEEMGVNKMSYMRGGKLIDQIMLGMSKPEAL